MTSPSPTVLPLIQPFAIGFGPWPREGWGLSKEFLVALGLAARRRGRFISPSSRVLDSAVPARTRMREVPAMPAVQRHEVTREYIRVRRSGDLGDLAAVLGVNKEALRRLVKGELDSGRKIPGVARVGRKYRVAVDAFLGAWRRGEISVTGWKS